MGAFKRKMPNLRRHEANIPVHDVSAGNPSGTQPNSSTDDGMGEFQNAKNTANSQERKSRKERSRRF